MKPKPTTSWNIIRRGLFLALGVLLMSQISGFSQDKDQVIDRVIAVIGDDIILQSDLENQFINYQVSGQPVTNNTRCELFEELLFQTLLLSQAKADSIEVTKAQVESEIDRRLRYFISQIGSPEKLEEFYGKPIVEIREEFRELIRDQLLVQSMQSNITADVKVTPAEVRDFFNSFPKDSLPYINAELEVAQIVKAPPISKEERERVKAKLQSLRDRVMKGESFGTLAYLYSEDPGSAKQNGSLDFMTRGQLVPEFAAVAFNLNPGEVSDIVETEYGYHLIQGVEKRGEQAHVRHILMIPKTAPADLVKAKLYLDSISGLMQKYDTLTFGRAATLYSTDKDTKNNDGMMVNPVSGTTKFELDQISQIDPGLFFVVDKLKVGEISKPEQMDKADGGQAYRLVKLISYVEPHRATLKQDYQRVQDVALIGKQEKIVREWVDKKIGGVYIQINDDFETCPFRNTWQPPR